MRPARAVCVLGFLSLSLFACHRQEASAPLQSANPVPCKRDPGAPMCVPTDVGAQRVATTTTEIPPSDKELRNNKYEREHSSPAARTTPPPRDFPPPRPYRPPPRK